LFKIAPVIAPRVTFLHEACWANGFELGQTVENPEPFLAPLPSTWAVSSESELLQRSSSCFTGQFSVAGTCVLGLCAFARMLITSPDLCFKTPSARPALCLNFLLKPLINPQIHQAVCQKKHFLSAQVCISTSFLLLLGLI
jgi:hypothetical protein